MNTFLELRDIFVSIPSGLYSWSVRNVDNVKDCKIIIHLLDDKVQILVHRLFPHGVVRLQLVPNDKIEAGFVESYGTKRIYKPWCSFELTDNVKFLEKYGGNKGKKLYQLLDQLQISDFI